MAVMAQWKHKTFEVSPRKLTPLEGLSTSMKVNIKNNKDNEGSPPTQTRSYGLQPVSFSFTVSDVAGVDVRREWEEWLELCGGVAPLYVAGLLFGPDNLELIEVSFEGDPIDSSGRIRKGVISLSFQEYAAEASAKKARVRDYVTINSGSAAGIGASQTDKTNLKPVSI